MLDPGIAKEQNSRVYTASTKDIGGGVAVLALNIDSEDDAEATLREGGERSMLTAPASAHRYMNIELWRMGPRILCHKFT